MGVPNSPSSALSLSSRNPSNSYTNSGRFLPYLYWVGTQYFDYACFVVFTTLHIYLFYSYFLILFGMCCLCIGLLSLATCEQLYSISNENKLKRKIYLRQNISIVQYLQSSKFSYHSWKANKDFYLSLPFWVYTSAYQGH